MRIRRRITASVAVLVLALGGYTAACALAPLPEPELQLSSEAAKPALEKPDPASVQAIVDAQRQPTAVGWAESDDTWANTDGAFQLASVSKLVTVLVALEESPIDPGADGPTHVWSEEDRAQQEEYIADDGIAFPVPVGTEMTTRQMLMLTLIPSANDFASAYARQVFGDNETFVAAVDAWADRHGLDSLRLAEPTGMDERNVASAADTLQIARLALANPTLTEFTSMPTATLPWGIGEVENTNPLFGMLPGITGLKTGTTSSAGFNLVAAQSVDADGRPLTKISVTFGRGSLEERAQAGYDTLTALDPLPMTTEVVADEVVTARATTAWGETTDIVTDGAVSTVLLPGEEAQRTLDLGSNDQGSVTTDAAAGTKVGEIRTDSPTGDAVVPLVTVSPLTEPDLWWRLTHPGALFGG